MYQYKVDNIFWNSTIKITDIWDQKKYYRLSRESNTGQELDQISSPTQQNARYAAQTTLDHAKPHFKLLTLAIMYVQN